jgi:hypothetical protein
MRSRAVREKIYAKVMMASTTKLADPSYRAYRGNRESESTGPAVGGRDNAPCHYTDRRDDRHADKLHEERNASISQSISIINIVSGVKHNNFRT